MWNLFRVMPSGKTYTALVSEDPNVKFDYVISEETSLSGHDNVTSDIASWEAYSLGGDYQIARSAIHTIAKTTTWANLSDEEKMTSLKYRAFPDTDTSATTVVGHLMSKGYQQHEAVALLITNGAKEQAKLIENCRYRGSSPILYMIIGKYLSIEDQANLNEIADIMLNKYMFRGLRGTLDGQDGNVGLFDFIEGTTGTVYEVVNLMSQNYTMINGDADATNLITDLMNWFRHGKTEFK